MRIVKKERRKQRVQKGNKINVLKNLAGCLAIFIVFFSVVVVVAVVSLYVYVYIFHRKEE